MLGALTASWTAPAAPTIRVLKLSPTGFENPGHVVSLVLGKSCTVQTPEAR